MTRVVVIGGGAAGLAAARAAALAGAEVDVLEAGDRLGGAVASVEVAGLAVDSGAESIASRGARGRELLAALGLDTAPPAPAGAWLHFADGAAPLPAAGVLGIPSSPLAADVRAVIGGRASWRAWCDRILPELSVGAPTNLGALVRRRMGPAVLERLVAPVVENVYGISPEDADPDALAPGLTGALTRTGALSAAVLALRSAAPAGSAVVGIVGGMHLLPERLAADIARFGGRIRTGARVLSVTRAAAGWDVHTAGETLPADRVVLAADGTAARELLAPLLPAGAVGDWPVPHRTIVVTLVVDAPALGAAPRGSGVLVARGVAGVRAGALTHSSAKWPWLAARLPAGRHVVRLSYRAGGGGEADAATALADAAVLLQVPRADLTLVDSAVTAWAQESSRGRIGMRARIDAVRAAVDHLDGLEVAGAWLAGTGLAAVLADGDRAGS
ncbi:MAG: hypothetical protein JWP66_459 [Naasia sp.]|nr:hypothetical protein [Naasia sp.]